MMEYIRTQRVKILVVEKVDRLVRSFKDTVLIDEWLEEDGERQVHFVKDSLVLHRGSRSQEKLNWGIRVVLAKNFIDNLKEEIEKGVREKLERGGLPHKAPPGYKTVGEKGRKELVPNEPPASLVTKMFGIYLSPTESVSSLTRKMNGLGLSTDAGRPIARSYIAEMLNNQIYIGKIPWKGQIYQGHHQPLVDEATFWAVQKKLTGRRAPRYQRHDALFRSLVTCKDCGSVVSWELQKGRYYGKCKGYRSCDRRHYVREDHLEGQLMRGLNGLLAPWPEVVSEALDQMRSDSQSDIALREAGTNQLRKRLAEIDRRSKLAYEDRLDGRITVERYDGLMATFGREQEEVKRDLATSEDEWTSIFEYNLRITELCQKASQIYEKATATERRALISEIFSNLAFDGPNVAYAWTETVAAIAQTAENDRELHRSFELRDYGSTKTKKALSRASFSLWYSLSSDLRTLKANYNSTSLARVQALLGVPPTETR